MGRVSVVKDLAAPLPKADIRGASLNRLVRAREHGSRYLDVQGLGRVQIDRQFEFGRVLKRKFRCRRTLQDTVDAIRGVAMDLAQVDAMTDLAARFRHPVRPGSAAPASGRHSVVRFNSYIGKTFHADHCVVE